MKKFPFDIDLFYKEHNFLKSTAQTLKSSTSRNSNLLVIGPKGRTYHGKFSLYVVSVNNTNNRLVYESHIGAFSTKKDALTAQQACIIFKALQ